MNCEVTYIKDGRVHVDGVDYGILYWSKIGDTFCCSQATGFSRSPFPVTIGHRFYEAEIILRDTPSIPPVYAVDKRDVLKIAQALSEEHGEVAVSIRSRFVAWFKDGALLGEVKTLDEFYHNLSEDEVNDTDLTPYVNDLKQK